MYLGTKEIGLRNETANGACRVSDSVYLSITHSLTLTHLYLETQCRDSITNSLKQPTTARSQNSFRHSAVRLRDDHTESSRPHTLGRQSRREGSIPRTLGRQSRRESSRPRTLGRQSRRESSRRCTLGRQSRRESSIPRTLGRQSSQERELKTTHTG